MDYYRGKIVRNIILLVIFIVGIILQFYGHSIESIKGLGIQFVSLVVLLIVMYLYNRRYR